MPVKHSVDNTIAKSAGRTPITLDGRFKGYATLANLQKALERANIADEFHVKCLTTEGRWTAVFPQSNMNGGYVGRYADAGFLMMG